MPRKPKAPPPVESDATTDTWNRPGNDPQAPNLRALILVALEATDSGLTTADLDLLIDRECNLDLIALDLFGAVCRSTRSSSKWVLTPVGRAHLALRRYLRDGRW